MQSVQSRPVPTFLHSCPNPKFNPKTKPNTNPIAAELQPSSASPKSSALTIFLQKTRSSTAHQQQVHNKSYKWSVGFNVNGRTFRRVIAVRPTYRMTYIHHIASLTAHMTCQTVYTISKDVRHSLKSFIGTARREGRFGASSPPTPPLSF